MPYDPQDWVENSSVYKNFSVKFEREMKKG